MKKCITLVFCLLSCTVVYNQKNSVEIGISTFNYFDGFGFKTSETLKLRSSPINRRLLNSIFLGFERSINDKSSLVLFYNGFDHTYQKSEPFRTGLKSRAFFELNLQYKRTLRQLWQNRLIIHGQTGINWRFEGTESFHITYIEYYSPNGTLVREPKEYGYYLFDFGPSVGASVKIKVFKGLFFNVQSNYSYYLIGEGLTVKKNSYGIGKSKQVLSATLSLGYRF